MSKYLIQATFVMLCPIAIAIFELLDFQTWIMAGWGLKLKYMHIASSIVAINCFIQFYCIVAKNKLK